MGRLDQGTPESIDEVLKPFTDKNDPKYPMGQIVFDINGEYANPNLQDQGTAIFDIYRDRTVRYSTVKKEGFREMKVNFFREVENGFDLIRSHPAIAADTTRFASNFRTVSLEKPQDYGSNPSAATRYDRKVCAYLCCLFRAGFEVPKDYKVSFTAGKDVCGAINAEIDPAKGVSLEEAANWWDTLWDAYDSAQFFADYKKKKSREWADEDLKALLVTALRAALKDHAVLLDERKPVHLVVVGEGLGLRGDQAERLGPAELLQRLEPHVPVHEKIVLRSSRLGMDD